LDLPYQYYDIQKTHISFANADKSDESDFIPLSYGSPDSSEEVTPKEISSLNDKISKQRCQHYASVATQMKQRLTFDLKNASIASVLDTPDSSDSETKLMMKLSSIQKLPWHPALETVMVADNANEDSERDTLDSKCCYPASETSMAADDADENSELDTSTPEQPPSPI
jgi:hypothetical protein